MTSQLHGSVASDFEPVADQLLAFAAGEADDFAGSTPEHVRLVSAIRQAQDARAR